MHIQPLTFSGFWWLGADSGSDGSLISCFVCFCVRSESKGDRKRGGRKRRQKDQTKINDKFSFWFKTIHYTWRPWVSTNIKTNPKTLPFFDAWKLAWVTTTASTTADVSGIENLRSWRRQVVFKAPKHMLSCGLSIFHFKHVDTLKYMWVGQKNVVIPQ